MTDLDSLEKAARNAIHAANNANRADMFASIVLAESRFAGDVLTLIARIRELESAVHSLRGRLSHFLVLEPMT